ncbi:hypothetical protein BJY04DRAFT_222804 [Aspergillus karnatakaensis]|uniref:uncharacterized protein n=1 Tax=Aspergillus karnatakaensis TaxID=1810916 RepID=UPI003CCCB54A
MPQLFSIASGLLLSLSILSPIHAAPFIPELHLPAAPIPFSINQGILQESPSSSTTELTPADITNVSNENNDTLLGLEYGKCYRIENMKKERLGYQQGAYYQYGNPDSRTFQVCRLSDGPCLREGGKADQKLRSTNGFYLYDTRGSSYSQGPTAHFQAWKDCDEADEGDPCPLAVNLKSAHNNWKGLANYPGGYIQQVANEYETVHWVFKEVKQCKGGRHGGDDVEDTRDLDI